MFDIGYWELGQCGAIGIEMKKFLAFFASLRENSGLVDAVGQRAELVGAVDHDLDF